MSEQCHGSCLCGAVKIAFKPKSTHADACHCRMCRRWGGGPFLAVEAEGGIALDGDEQLTVYDSSDWAQRGFCSRCGTHLFYRLKDPVHYAIPAGLLDDGGPWSFTTQIFIDEKPDWYAFANDTKNMTGAEVFAAFGSPSSN